MRVFLIHHLLSMKSERLLKHLERNGVKIMVTARSLIDGAIINKLEKKTRYS